MGVLGKRRGKDAKGVGQPAASGSASIGGSLSRDDHYYLQEAFDSEYLCVIKTYYKMLYINAE